ncbi:lysosomal Pro-X carboxypeptidase [Cimex lectularius]|uniref:Lysosomal Pro-X carboxypeptidase n=1 Tax=Cimex lectularius TaxID=79782 RepID=A0A8I6S6M2_CIMLE|nr:lysosomal Pro-X carboxypeptidase [Cimex lectularius]
MYYTLLYLFVVTWLCPSNGYVYRTEYFDTKLDNFAFASNETFKLRYLINDTFWNPGRGPIFFYTGNEGDITDFAENTGFMWETAPEFDALVLFAEHRYYGKSLPFGNLSTSEPKYSGYLTASQAMMDYIELLSYIKVKYNATVKEIPVIAFGGSYGGMLAAWIRMKYPSVIAGSLASSAPIWQFTGMTECSAFSRVTTSAYSSVSPECSKRIRDSWSVLTELGKTDAGKAKLNTLLNTCKPLKTDSDVQGVKDYLQTMYVNIAMVNYPYPANFIGNLPANPVKAVCKNMLHTNETNESILSGVYNSLLMYINGTGTAKCFDITNDVEPFGVGGWNIQSCTEMVMPMCNNGETDMFEKSSWDLKKVSDDCFKQYKLRPSVNIIRDLFGGKRISWATNIIFSNGLLDPWSSGGVLHNVSKTAVAVIIPESAHHLDLRAQNENDPTTVRMARKYYKSVFKKWIQDFYSDV